MAGCRQRSPERLNVTERPGAIAISIVDANAFGDVHEDWLLNSIRRSETLDEGATKEGANESL